MSRRAATWVWVGCALGLSPLFYLFDWGQGPLRTGLLVVWLVVGVGLGRGLGHGHAPEPGPWGRRAAWLVALGLLGFHLYVGAREIEHTARTGAIKLDQGQIAYRAIRWLGEIHLNPYGHEVMLDPVYYMSELQRHQPSGCLAFTPAAPAASAGLAERRQFALRLLDAQRRLWDGLDPGAMAALMPAVDPAERCARARLGFRSLGFKYGPLDLLAYVPTVLAFGPAGVFVTQLLAFVGIVALVALLAAQRAGKRSAAVPLALCVLLGMPHLHNNVLTTSALDAVPTLLALAALWAHGARRGALAALLLGAALASKPLPGLLYAPLLAAYPARTLLVALVAALVPYVPFALWDAEGLWNNVVLYPLTRPTDSTALAHFLPAWAQAAWLGLCALGVGYTLFATLRARAVRSVLWSGLFASHLLVLAAAGYLHNNYFTWLAPVLALWTVQLWGSPQPGSGVQTPVAG